MKGRSNTKNLATVAALVGVLGVMTGLVVASVPLYRLFCQATGYGGTPRTATAAPDHVVNRVVTVQFDTNVNSALPWRFQPVKHKMNVRLGEQSLAFFRVKNLGDKPTVGSATFNVSPAKAGPYFNKIQCFCFTEQRLKPGESADMTVSFFVDPEMAKDRKLNDVTEITLSYTMFRNKQKEQENAKLETSSPRADNGKTPGAFDLALKQ